MGPTWYNIGPAWYRIVGYLPHNSGLHSRVILFYHLQVYTHGIKRPMSLRLLLPLQAGLRTGDELACKPK